MNTRARRYIFVDYNNLLQVKFKKLEKVASRIFVFIESRQDTVPLSLVRQTQRSGNNLKWIVVSDTPDGKLNYHIAFIMGKLHQKLDGQVEFAVVSNDADFDPLIAFINNAGRSCIRVKRKSEEKTMQDLEFSGDGNEVVPVSKDDDSIDDIFGGDTPVDVLVEEELITKTAEETVKRLIRSGNRPAEVATLKNYIHLHNQELSLHGHIERIIQKMKDSKDIEIHKGEVIYNF